MIKVIFEGSIFLHQKKRISKYIQKFSWDKCTLETGKLYR